MQFFRLRRLMLAGAMASGLAFGSLAVGGVVEIGEAFALQEDAELDGVVEVMPTDGMIGTWRVSGKTVQVTEATRIDQEMGVLAVGAPVEVEGEMQADGSILASELEVEDVR